MTRRHRNQCGGAPMNLMCRPQEDCEGIFPGTPGGTILPASPAFAQEARSPNISPQARLSNALLDADDLADLFGVSRRTVFRLRARGAIPRPLKIGGTLLRWRLNDIVQFLNTSRRA